MRTNCCSDSVQFTEMVHTHFDNRCFVMIFNAEHCQRHTNFIVVVAVCPQSVIFLRKHRSDHIFCCCFTNTACDTYIRDIKQISVICCQIQQCFACIRHQQNDSTIFRCNHLLRKACCYAVFKTLRQEVMTISHFTDTSNEEYAFLCFSGILSHIPDLLFQCFFHITKSDHLGTCCLDDFSYFQFFHTKSSPNAFCTSSISSK